MSAGLEPEPEPAAMSRSLSASFSQAWKDDVGTTGCTKLTATLLHEMKRRDARYGIVTMCIGGGMGAAGLFERTP